METETGDETPKAEVAAEAKTEAKEEKKGEAEVTKRETEEEKKVVMTRELQITDILDTVKKLSRTVKKHTVSILQGKEKVCRKIEPEKILEKDEEIEAKKVEYENQRKMLQARLQLAMDELGAKTTLLEAAKDKLQKENIDNLVDFIEGNNKKEVSKKKKKRKTNKLGQIAAQSLNIPEQLSEEKLATNCVTGNSIVVDEHKLNEEEELSIDEEENIEGQAAKTILEVECKDDDLNKNIECILEQLREKKRLAEELAKSKAKEMTRLLCGIDSAEDNKSKGMKYINNIDDQIRELLKKKGVITKECNKHEEVKIKLEIKKAKLKEFISTSMKNSNANIVKLEKKLETFRSKRSETQVKPKEKQKDENKLETRQQANQKLLAYIDQQISSKESSLECPVCLEVASTPIFMCEEQHLLCGSCRPRIQACPECRLQYTRNRRHR